MTDLQFPIGRFKLEGTPTDEDIRRAISEIAEAPAKLRAAVEGLSPDCCVPCKEGRPRRDARTGR